MAERGGNSHLKKEIVITDLTRMYYGNVCIAGYDREYKCIRPILKEGGISEKDCFVGEKPILFPFAVIELDLLSPSNQMPHTEDYFIEKNSIKYLRKAKNPENMLQKTLFEQVADIFGQEIHDDLGFYVLENKGDRSLGTIQPRGIHTVKYEKDIRGNWDYRLSFYDIGDKYFRLKITDLTWQYFCRSQRSKGQTPTGISEFATRVLKSSRVYLRIGLSRGWDKFPDRCYLQINGIYTFPDYLNGKTFLDYK